MLTVDTGFSLSVSAGPGYDGTPSIVTAALEAHAGAVALGNLGGGFNSADPSSGIATGTGFSYSEVGNFRFLPNAIRDTGFTSGDQPTGCVSGSTANLPDGSGRIGCDFANPGATAWIGRFTPDHFDVAVVEPGRLANSCTGFSYAGTGLSYSVDPAVMITAKSGGGTTTRNYTGAYNKLQSSEVSLSALNGDASAMGADGSTPVAISLVQGSRNLVDNGDGTLLLRLSGDVFTYGRGPNDRVGEFVGDVSRTLTSLTDTEDGTAAAGLPLDLSPIGVPIRYGRLSIANAHGSELQTLPLSMRVEYFAGASNGFLPSSGDGCTTINTVAIADGDASDALLPAAACIWDPSGSSGSFACDAPGDSADHYRASPVNSDFNLNLMAPAGGATGVLKVSADAPPWLEFDWQGSGDIDPVGLATFGIYRGDPRVIYMREVR
jgi:MSHA biogenesis protein MshQ